MEMEQNILRTIKNTREFMNGEKLLTTASQQIVINIINSLLTTQQKLNVIGGLINSITEDGVIDISDVPRFINLFIISSETLFNQCKVGATVNTSNMKYVCFGVLLFCLRKYNSDFENIDLSQFEKNFNSLWSLVELNINIINKVKSCC